MTLNQRQTLLLLLGLTVTSGVVTSHCVFNEYLTHCVCNIISTSHAELFFCVELELRDSKLDVSQIDSTPDPTLLHNSNINKLIFNNVTIPSSFINAVMAFLPQKLNEINIISSTLEVDQPFLPPMLLQNSKITALLLEDVTVDQTLLQPSFQPLHHWLFSSLKSFRLIRSGLVEIDCYWAQKAENLTYLDLSENHISDSSLQNISRCSSLSFKSLKSLHLRNTNLTSLQSLCSPLSVTPALTQLDVSGNSFSILHFPHCLQMKLLQILNLSHSRITEVNSSLPASLEELDLSYNYLETFSNPPQSLKKLYLSNNRLVLLPSLENLLYLKELKVDSNQLTVLINGTGEGLSKLKQLDVLHAGRNPYQCDCALKETIIFLNSTGGVTAEDYPDEFLCATPAAQQGTQIMKLSLESCVKPTSGTQHRHGSHLCLTLFIVLLSRLVCFC